MATVRTGWISRSMLVANSSIDGVLTDVPFEPLPPGTGGGTKGCRSLRIPGAWRTLVPPL